MHFRGQESGIRRQERSGSFPGFLIRPSGQLFRPSSLSSSFIKPKDTITFSTSQVTGFENTPLKGVNEGEAMAQVDKIVRENLRDYLVAIAGAGKEGKGRTWIKPIHIEKVSKETVRVTLSPRTTLYQLYRLQDIEQALKEEGGEAIPFAVFIDYGAVRHSREGKVPFKHRKTFFVFAEQGVELKKGESQGKVERTVVLKDVVGMGSLTARGKTHTVDVERFAKTIGTGEHPFKPNGSFMILENGAPKQCTLAFDKASWDPKTHDMTFTVGLLKNEKTGKADPTGCFEGAATSYKGKTILFIDTGSSTEK